MPPKKNVLGKRAKGSNGVRATSVPNGLDAASSAAASKKRAPSRGHSAKRVPTVAISLDEALEASKLQAVAAAASQVASAPESVLRSACQLSSQAHTICRRRRREAGRLRRISAAPTCHLAEAHFGGLKDGHTKVLRCGGAGIAARCCRRERTLRDVSYLRFSTAPLMAAETRDCCVSDEPTMDPCLTSKRTGNMGHCAVHGRLRTSRARFDSRKRRGSHSAACAREQAPGVTLDDLKSALPHDLRVPR